MGVEAVNLWTDPEGDHWPITGDWCNECRLPMIRVDHHDTHPTCDPRKDSR